MENQGKSGREAKWVAGLIMVGFVAALFYRLEEGCPFLKGLGRAGWLVLEILHPVAHGAWQSIVVYVAENSRLAGEVAQAVPSVLSLLRGVGC